jgi:hypothetical protein
MGRMREIDVLIVSRVTGTPAGGMPGDHAH